MYDALGLPLDAGLLTSDLTSDLRNGECMTRSACRWTRDS